MKIMFSRICIEDDPLPANIFMQSLYTGLSIDSQKILY